MLEHVFFNAHHSPMGAFASFTLGFPGQSGGMGMELGKPADQNVYIGLENAEQPGVYQALPFFKGFEDDIQRFGLGEAVGRQAEIRAFPREGIRRDYQVASDTWTCGDLTFRLYSPVHAIPDPQKGDSEALKKALLPAVMAELTIDNRRGQRFRKAFLGFQGNDPYSNMRRLDDTAPGLKGIAQGRRYAIATNSPDVVSGLGFGMENILAPTRPENLAFGIGTVGALVATVPAGQVWTGRFVIGFYREGLATAGWDTSYYYTRFYPHIEAVADYGLRHFEDYVAWAQQANTALAQSPLSADQKFMLAHAIHSYYGSSQLLDANGRPVWVINEGEYRMMNTLDLTADQLFFEMTMNPWTTRNVLEWALARYSYRDHVRFPGQDTEHPGGLSFTHDMGVGNVFWRSGYSSYEQFGLSGCFSHMTHEQLVNWVLCAAAYIEQARDRQWLDEHGDILKDCLQSLVHRDHPDPAQRNGVMGLDSGRCLGGSEITTYDSLDASLGQARNNVYLAVKSFAAYLVLDRLFQTEGNKDLAAQARAQADRCVATLLSHVTAEGFIPAVIGENVNSRIIPVVEGLAFAWMAGCREDLTLEGCYGAFLKTLRGHLETVLVKGRCLFADNGWKISSTSDNSWLSKVYICQFVARKILGLPWDQFGQAADAAHVGWLLHPQESYWCWSDQIISGVPRASRYYPRGVSSILWMYETSQNIGLGK